MQFPSITQLINQVKQVVFRFPLKVCLVIVAAFAAITIVDRPYELRFFADVDLIRIIIFCNLSLTSTLATDLYCDASGFSQGKKWLLKIIALIVSALIIWIANPLIKQSYYFVWLLFGIAFHLMVAFAGFLRSNSIQDFWDFNKTLFIRLLTAALYSGVIIVGLFLAIFAIEQLFTIKIDEKIYFKTFLSIVIVFNTLFFLAGVPDLRNKDFGTSIYPKGLKVFTQYVLIPLMTIYLIILLMYELKILIEWQLPNGYVSVLILAYSVFGILSLLLIHPIRNQEGNGWIRWFSKLFYLMMLPLLVLLILAIYKRVSEYGITEERYALIVLAVWLLGITIYFLLSKKDNIKIIPISLAVVALLSAIGPQSMISVSKWSQQQRLKKYYPSKNKKEAKEIISIVRYLTQQHGILSIQPFTQQNLKLVENHYIKMAAAEKELINNYWQLSDTAFTILNLDKTAENYDQSINFYNQQRQEIINIENFKYLLPLETSVMDQNMQIDNLNIKIKKEYNDDIYHFTINQRDTFSVSLDTIFNKINEKYSYANIQKDIFLSNDEMSVEYQNHLLHMKLVLSNYTTNFSNLKYYRGYLLLRPKNML